MKLTGKKALPLAALMVTGSAFAIDNMTTICTHSDKQRKIELVYPENTQTPCEVRYTKGGDTKVLWSASLEAGYCEMKYADFVKKQEGWGWTCTEEGGTATEAPAESEGEAEDGTEEGATSS